MIWPYRELVMKDKEEQARHKIDDLEKKLAAIRAENMVLESKIDELKNKLKFERECHENQCKELLAQIPQPEEKL